ncbi:SWIM zinc finger family protein [Allokutzneria oryzae]|uniref:SWIM zinc finger family protein n=1 Tax=Allokutzneria oryzae TaxID=1378989 RepID=A0ABV6A1A2_9PSEU
MNARGFPAFGPSRRGRGHFAKTWWGRAWIKALEDTALDERPLKEGRRYAYTGKVGPITVSPGRLAAPVHDAGDEVSYNTVVRLAPLSERDWERFLDQVASRAGHIAALLDRDMPHDLVSSAEDAGVSLLPHIGDLEPDCDCPEWELPCKHAAALAFQASWLLDADPFVLLLIRGKGERELLEELQTRNVLARARPAPGTPVAEAYSRLPGPLPEVPCAPTEPVSIPAIDPPPGVTPEALRRLITDAAQRARELLADSVNADPSPALTLWQDTVRLAALHPELNLASPRAARAWQHGGRQGLQTLESTWNPTRLDLARARTALAATWDDSVEPPEFEVSRNHWTLTGRGVQLRLGRDGRWYPYRQESGEWWPAGAPERDPAAALAELLGGPD